MAEQPAEGGELVSSGFDAVPLATTDAAQSDAERLALSFLLGFAGHTRRAYTNDLRGWFGWCAKLGVDPLVARRSHIDAYARWLAETPQSRTGRPSAPATIARRLSAIAGLYQYGVDEEIVDRSPAAHIKRPKVADDSQTTGPDRDGLRALLAVARADGLRSSALISLLALNGLRIDEALARDVGDLDVERGHRVLRLVRKGGQRATAVLSAPTVHAIDEYLAGREDGPLFITKTGKRMDQPAAWRLVRRLARTAGVAVDKLNPHGFRHGFITAALDAGVSLRDVQDAAGHADPRTTRRYDRSRHNLDRAATYAVTAFLADDEAPRGSGERVN